MAFQDDVAKYAKGNSELNVIRRVIEVAPSAGIGTLYAVLSEISCYRGEASLSTRL